MPTRRDTLRSLALSTAALATGCGTVLYPERKGQPKGQLDVGIVLLDAVWLLVGIIPGVIAFAVDFSNGCIYLPSGSAELKQVPIPTREQAEYEAALTVAAGERISLDDPRLRYLAEEMAVSARGLREMRDAPPPAERLVRLAPVLDANGVVIDSACV